MLQLEKPPLLRNLLKVTVTADSQDYENCASSGRTCAHKYGTM